MNWIQSKTIWGTLVGAAVVLAHGYGVIPDNMIPALSAVSMMLFGVGIRHAIAKK